MKRTITLITLIAALALAGCGSTNTTTTIQGGSVSSTTMTQAQAGQAYLTAVEPGQKALAILDAKLRTFNGSSPQSELAAAVEPANNAIGEVQTKLSQLAAAYPVAAVDLKAQITAVGVVRGDLAAVENSSAWVQTFIKDIGAANADAKIVRADLGLPPSTNK